MEFIKKHPERTNGDIHCRGEELVETHASAWRLSASSLGQSLSHGYYALVPQGFLGTCAVTKRVPAVQADLSPLGTLKCRDRCEKTEGDGDQHVLGLGQQRHHQVSDNTESHTSPRFSVITKLNCYLEMV